MFSVKLIKTSLLQKVLILTMLIEAQFFYLFPLPDIFWYGNNPDNKSYILIILYFTLFTLLVVNKFMIKKSQYYSFIKPFLVFQTIVMIILIARSKYLYSQSWFSMTQCSDYLFMLMPSVAFMIAMKENADYKKMMYILVIIVFICQIAIFLNGIILTTTGVTLFQGMRETGNIAVRTGVGVRSARNALNFIGIGYSFNCLLNKNDQYMSKGLNECMFILSVINLMFFNGYRTIMIASFCMMLMIFLCSRSIRMSTKISILILICIVLFVFGLYDKIIESFSTEGDLAGSTLTRMGAYEFFWNRFKDNPVFGFGMIRPYTERTWLLFGGMGRFAVTDAGIVGLLSEVGLLGASAYLILFIRGIYIAIKVKGDYNRPFLFGVLIYIVASCPSIIVTNIPRCMAIPVCIAIFESVYYRYKNNKVINKKSYFKRRKCLKLGQEGCM